MANDCSYWMKIVAKDEATLDRFAQIMKYKDPEFYVYRVFEYEETYREEVDGLFVATAYGEVAWGCSAWLNDAVDRAQTIDTGAHYSNLSEVCKALGIAIEVWGEEFGMCFQEHIFVAKDGTYSFINKSACSVDWDDEESVNEAKECCENVGIDFETAYKGDYFVGGFEDFEECESAKVIWDKKELSLWIEC